MTAASDFDEQMWKKIIELGWLSIAIPEAYGGLEMGLGAVVPVIESMGRQLMISPFLATTLAAHTLVKNGSEQQKNNYLPKIAEGAISTLALTEEDGSWLLEEIDAKATENNGQLQLIGTKTFVLDAAHAEIIIASVNIGGKAKLVVIEKNQIPQGNIQKETVIDETRNCYRLSLEGINISPSQVLDKACFSDIEQAALLLLSAEMVGGIASALNAIVEYLNTRKQFGKIIGSYQALKHPTAEILMGMEEARSLVYHAASIFDEADDPIENKELECALRMAKASAGQHFLFAGDRAVQFHGGFGFTYDCNAQLFLRRAIWSQSQFGDDKYQRQLLAPLLLDSPSL
jgi:alkylation response protein AidB-like acyl-CoA dehydrogenase